MLGNMKVKLKKKRISNMCLHGYRDHNFLMPLRRCISALPGKALKTFFFLIFKVFACNITLCRGQHFACEVRIYRAHNSDSVCPGDVTARCR